MLIRQSIALNELFLLYMHPSILFVMRVLCFINIMGWSRCGCSTRDKYEVISLRLNIACISYSSAPLWKSLYFTNTRLEHIYAPTAIGRHDGCRYPGANPPVAIQIWPWLNHNMNNVCDSIWYIATQSLEYHQEKYGNRVLSFWEAETPNISI